MSHRCVSRAKTSSVSGSGSKEKKTRLAEERQRQRLPVVEAHLSALELNSSWVWFFSFSFIFSSCVPASCHLLPAASVGSVVRISPVPIKKKIPQKGTQAQCTTAESHILSQFDELCLVNASLTLSVYSEGHHPLLALPLLNPRTASRIFNITTTTTRITTIDFPPHSPPPARACAG